MHPAWYVVFGVRNAMIDNSGHVMLLLWPHVLICHRQFIRISLLISTQGPEVSRFLLTGMIWPGWIGSAQLPISLNIRVTGIMNKGLFPVSVPNLSLFNRIPGRSILVCRNSQPLCIIPKYVPDSFRMLLMRCHEDMHHSKPFFWPPIIISCNPLDHKPPFMHALVADLRQLLGRCQVTFSTPAHLPEITNLKSQI